MCSMTQAGSERPTRFPLGKLAMPPSLYTDVRSILWGLWDFERYRDIYSQWPIIESIIEFYGANQPLIQPAAGPGHWNDADQLTVGDHHPQGWYR